MDPETREVLFGRATKLGRRGWSPGLTKVFFLEATAQAVVAEMTDRHTLRVQQERSPRSPAASYAVDPARFTHEGKPVYTLTDATRRLPAVRKKASSSPVHSAALALEEIFGTTYYLSESVVDNLMAGDHFFVVGGKPVARMRFGADFTLDGAKLRWAAGGGSKHATLGGKPVFVVTAIGERLIAQKKLAAGAAKPGAACSKKSASRGSKPNRAKAGGARS